jgi:hypothetical protein
MIELIVTVLLYVFGQNGHYVPMRPAPYVAPYGTVQNIPDPLPYTNGPFLFEQEWGPGA